MGLPGTTRVDFTLGLCCAGADPRRRDGRSIHALRDRSLPPAIILVPAEGVFEVPVSGVCVDARIQAA